MRHCSASAYVDFPKVGISDYLNGRLDELQNIIVKHPQNNNLYVTPVGTIPPNPTELLTGTQFENLVYEARNQYDYVFIDCPPIELVADT